ncbi:MAG TPA: hypothetical protein VF503_23735 [Sphingobium sp.]|uniref:hypothetical protein n=1 Tax=Sphingobium sp. TaxID=1912891 RepID=UPI002ED26832
MSGLVERMERAAQARADALRGRVRARLARLLPGVSIREEGDRIELRGRDLAGRWSRSDDLRDWREMEP